jgi:hypothetical protein
MKKLTRSKLALTREVIRHLQRSDLAAIATANSGVVGSAQITQRRPALGTALDIDPSQCSRADSGCEPSGN